MTPPLPFGRRLGRTLSVLPLVLLSLATLGADVSPCGRSRRPMPAVAPTSEPAATPDNSARLRDCCRQCTAAASRDPAGVDLSVQPCSRYGTEPAGGGPPALDADCARLLTEQRTLVGACQKLTTAQ